MNTEVLHVGDTASETKNPITRFVSLPHTEGCGVSSGASEELYRRTILSHLVSPIVQYGVLLEHGCEKTHNDYMADYLTKDMNQDKSQFGWASVQLDGGIESVTKKVWDLFQTKLQSAQRKERAPADLKHLRLAILTPSDAQVSDGLSKSLAKLAHAITGSGGTVVIPQNSRLALSESPFLKDLLQDPTNVKVSLGYGQKFNESGFHIMETTSDSWVETVTGLGATGVELMLCALEGRRVRMPTPSHPMFPMLRIINSTGVCCGTKIVDADLLLSDDMASTPDSLEGAWYEKMLELVVSTAGGATISKTQGNNDFQIARGLLGISM